MTEAETPHIPEDGSSAEPITNVFRPVISAPPKMSQILAGQGAEARLRQQKEQEEPEPA